VEDGAYNGDCFAGQRYFGLANVGLPAGWPVKSPDWACAVSLPYINFPDNGSALCKGCSYGELSESSVEHQSPPKITVYTGHTQTCPRVNGKPLYRIAVPPDRPDRRGKMLQTHQENLSVAHNYWYTEGTLNFVTVQEERIEMPINSIDRTLTLQLNRECGVNFQFPGSVDRTH